MISDRICCVLMLSFTYFSRFIAERKNDNYYVPTGQISFDVELVDNGNNFNIMDGTFTIPSDGTYWFLFNGYIGKSGDHNSRIDIMVNGEQQRYYFDYQARDVTFQFSLELNRNDELWLENHYESSYYANSDHVMTFLGYRIN